MSTFADIRQDEIKYDCRFYTGYKPCHRFDGCPDCPHYEKRGEQILIIKLGAMGDVLRTKSLLPGLKKAHPESWIVWLTNPGSEVIVRDPLVDEIRVFDSEGLAALEGRTWARILCLDKDPHAVALSGKLPAAQKQGFAPTAYNTVGVWNPASMYALRLGLSDELKYRQNTKSVPEILYEMAELEYGGEDYSLSISDKARAAASGVWSKLGIPTGKNVIGLNTGCGPVFATKGWPKERMAEFIDLFRDRSDSVIVLLGGPRERELHGWLLEQAGELKDQIVFDSGNDNSLETFFGIVEKCDLVLSADSLAMHIAIALKRPVVTWFGPTCEQEIDLFGRGEKIVTDFPCSPCYFKTCPQEVFCLDEMKPRQVLAAADRVLQQMGTVEK